MSRRLLLLALLLGAEVLAASLVFDGAQISGLATGFPGFLRDWGAWGVRWSLSAAAIFGIFAVLGRVSELPGLGPFVRPGWLLVHAVSLAAFGMVTRGLYESGTGVAAVWVLLGLTVAVSAACAFVPPAVWLEWRRQTGSLWLQALAGATFATWLGALSRQLWSPATAATFWMVKALLAIFLEPRIVDPSIFRINTGNYGVIISPECSGLEGVGLYLTFCIFWLVLFRDDIRFPHALILLPMGMATLYLLNAVRITAILLIGHAGFREIATRGFHSQAGTLFFCAVAIALLFGARRVSWIAARTMTDDAEYPASPYLVPFLVVVAAGMVAQAMSGNFEWLYVLRPVAAAFALWRFRGSYRGIDWSFGALAVGAGVSVFVLWIATHWLIGAPHRPMPAALAEASLPVRALWLTARVFGAVVTVPMVEELAFRGFGLRRLVDDDFEAVPWRTVSWMGLGVSSVLFGVLHGALWPAGIVAGLVYGGVMVRGGRLGDAVGAHATTNALLAAYVLFQNQWELW